MFKDELYKPSVYQAPPENLEAAIERGQVLYDPSPDWDTCRQAAQRPPETEEEIHKRAKAAGIHPTNLIESVWKNVEQFAAMLREYGWKPQVYCHRKTADAGRYKVYYCVARASRNNKMIFTLWDKPHHLQVTTAILLSASESAQQALKEVAELMEHHSDDVV